MAEELGGTERVDCCDCQLGDRRDSGWNDRERPCKCRRIRRVHSPDRQHGSGHSVGVTDGIGPCKRSPRLDPGNWLPDRLPRGDRHPAVGVHRRIGTGRSDQRRLQLWADLFGKPLHRGEGGARDRRLGNRPRARRGARDGGDLPFLRRFGDRDGFQQPPVDSAGRPISAGASEYRRRPPGGRLPRRDQSGLGTLERPLLAHERVHLDDEGSSHDRRDQGGGPAGPGARTSDASSLGPASWSTCSSSGIPPTIRAPSD